jgi:hypothetical protein
MYTIDPNKKLRADFGPHKLRDRGLEEWCLDYLRVTPLADFVTDEGALKPDRDGEVRVRPFDKLDHPGRFILASAITPVDRRETTSTSRTRRWTWRRRR